NFSRSECMYPAGMDFPREAGMVLVPTRFVWPYGGRIVYIAGSFTGWTQWPMTPVEGCPTVFQTICSLPPGFHQLIGYEILSLFSPSFSCPYLALCLCCRVVMDKYKFMVDGEWRHDERQPFISSNIGTVNTILLTREPDYVPPVLGSSMDVDDAFQRMVRESDGRSPEAFPTLSETDLEISRHRVAVFMSTHMAYELLPESGKVIALDVDLPVKQAFHILHEQGICMAPLWNFAKGKFVGVISSLDFILIMREAGPDDSLKDVALKILQNGVATVPILYSSSPDASNPHLLHLASLSGILKCICRFFKHSPSSLPILQLPIYAIPLGTWVPKIGEANRQPLAMLRPSSSLSAALNLLIQAQVSSIPIVDDNDSLLDVYSRSDITALAKDKIYAHINLDETTIHQALQYRDDPFSPYGSNTQRCFMCLRSDPLHKVLERLSQPGVRRIVVVEAGSKHVEGIISLGDVFRFLM
ncbi:5'-AMP-activated protein kinase subunit gamma, partial [Striga asiatica]